MKHRDAIKFLRKASNFTDLQITKLVIFGRSKYEHPNAIYFSLAHRFAKFDTFNVDHAWLTRRQIKECLFGGFGDEASDTSHALFDLNMIEVHGQHHRTTPYVLVDRNMMGQLFDCVQNIQDTVVPLLHDRHSCRDEKTWEAILRSLIDTYIHDLRDFEITWDYDALLDWS